MHGVKRSEQLPEEAVRQQEEEEQPQIAHYKGLIARVLRLRDESGDHSGQDMDVAGVIASTAELLLLNPDFLTAWNLRRRALARLRAAGDIEAVSQEFEFSLGTIKVNPKSYGAWYHRQWLVGEVGGVEPGNRRRELPEFEVRHELKLCARLLDLDSRNFHCWNYRWFLYERFAVDAKSEFDFTTLMIYKNFSNYSAWHRRTLLFPQLASTVDEEVLRKTITDDLQLVKSAYFTEPADQSCWFYLRWLVEFAEGRPFFRRNEIVGRELENIGELLAIEPDSPLALHTWIDLATRAAGVVSTELLAERLQRLIAIDPQRAGMYKDVLATNCSDRGNPS